jgi:hypothetical protein
MAVYVRKLAKKRSIECILHHDVVENICADSISDEFRTKDNKLSIWEIPDENIDLGILAIALSSSRIETMDFIVLTRSMIEEAGLTIEKTTSKQNPLIGASNMHYDISNLCLCDFARLASAYRCAGSDETRVKRYTQGELKEKISQAKNNGLIDSTNATDEIKKVIEAL